uniref:Glycoside hydrolase family 28 n=1 Tax=Extatosoma tiaratum TaxID=7024 RepID=A0A191XSY8_EXTTI|nr:glycoside hydrolase family 28 [Extatosoma tiaratum]
MLQHPGLSNMPCLASYPMCKATYMVVLLMMATLHEGNTRDLRQVSEPKIPASCVSLRGNGGDETSVLQKALSSCAKGRVVHLASGTFVSGLLTIPSGVGLWIDSKVVLKASSNPKAFDLGKNICGALSSDYAGCNPLIRITGATDSGVYGKGIIDGQGGEKMTGKGMSWWELAREAQVKKLNENCPSLIEITNSRDITVYQITLKNSPGLHAGIRYTNGTTVWGVTINTPSNARNTDGIDPSGAQNVTIAHSSISCGDDNIAIKGGNTATRHMSIVSSHFGSGHGLSIGSETYSGVSDITATSLTFDGTLNGLHIKSDRSRGGLVTGITYSNVCIKNVDYPINLDSEYNKTATGNRIPEYRDITFNNIKVLTAGKYIFNGFSDAKPIQATLNNVHIAKGSTWTASHAKISGKYYEDASGSSC